jgi:hypothetical protein
VTRSDGMSAPFVKPQPASIARNPGGTRSR